MPMLYHYADVVVGNAGVGQLDTIAIESMACGKPTAHYVNEFYPDVPLLHDSSKFPEQVETFLFDEKKTKRWVEKQLDYVQKNHNVKVLIPKLLKIYREVWLNA